MHPPHTPEGARSGESQHTPHFLRCKTGRGLRRFLLLPCGAGCTFLESSKLKGFTLSADTHPQHLFKC